ncbi:MAG: hypothetical protein EA397_19780 [Deltaproteobacteria bacterium]|nr:MAG: hypothetical protein EA397_19780 [Deltaproteobacteria bacterium]
MGFDDRENTLRVVDENLSILEGSALLPRGRGSDRWRRLLAPALGAAMLAAGCARPGPDPSSIVESHRSAQKRAAVISEDVAEPIAYPTDLDSDIVQISPPCVLTASGEIWCWGEPSGSHALTRMDLPLSSGVPPYHYDACGWTDQGLVCTGEPGSPSGGIGLSGVWWDQESVIFPGGSPATRNFRVRPEATEVVVTPCPHWDFGLVWRVGDRLETDCLPTDVSSLADTVSLAGGGDHVCGVHADGGVSCLLLMPNRGKPMSESGDGRIPGLSDVVEVVTTNGMGCARHSTGRVSCFGERLGLREYFGDIASHKRDAQPPIDIGVEGATALALSNGHFCIAQGPRLQCFEPLRSSMLRVESPVYGLPPVVSMSPYSGPGDRFGGCALSVAGVAWCWDSSTAFVPKNTGLRPVALEGQLALTQDGDLHRFQEGAWAVHTRSIWPEPPDLIELQSAPGRVCLEAPGHEKRCVQEMWLAGALRGDVRIDEEGRAFFTGIGFGRHTSLSGRGRWSYLEVEGGRMSDAKPIERRTLPPPLSKVPWPSVTPGVPVVASHGRFVFDAEGWAYRDTPFAPDFVFEGHKPADPVGAEHCPFDVPLKDCEQLYASVGVPLRWTHAGALTPNGQLMTPLENLDG